MALPELLNLSPRGGGPSSVASAGGSLPGGSHPPHSLTGEDLGKIIRICYAWVASNAGVSFPLFESPKRLVPHLQGTVVPAIREFLSNIDAKIYLDNTMIRPKL